MLSVEPVARDEAQEELRSVGVGSGVGHGEISSLGVLDGEVLVSELHSVDGLSSSSVSGGEVSSLGHEVGDDSVEGRSLEVEGLSGLTDSLLSSAESSEVLGGLWGVSGELHGDSASSLTTNSDVEENVRHIVCFSRKNYKS